MSEVKCKCVGFACQPQQRGNIEIKNTMCLFKFQVHVFLFSVALFSLKGFLLVWQVWPEYICVSGLCYHLFISLYSYESFLLSLVFSWFIVSQVHQHWIDNFLYFPILSNFSGALGAHIKEFINKRFVLKYCIQIFVAGPKANHYRRTSCPQEGKARYGECTNSCIYVFVCTVKPWFLELSGAEKKFHQVFKILWLK